MDRCAIFVDAGYLLAAGGELCCRTKERSEIDCAYEQLINSLVREVANDSRMPVLRVYWYDGAPQAIPLSDHLEIAHLPDVKLRLGRLSGGKQKGVDSLIVRDLMTLARERAVASAYLISGDEDIREGVAAAQDMGVRVTLLGIPPVRQRFNQSQTLVREADQHIILAPDFWSRHFKPKGVAPDSEVAAGENELDVAHREGKAFGEAWASNATSDEILELLGRAPRLPRELDAQILRKARLALGVRLDEDRVRGKVRASFWEALAEARDVRTS